eukprot:6202819-Pleurochrysis_carterae.AAC.1
MYATKHCSECLPMTLVGLRSFCPHSVRFEAAQSHVSSRTGTCPRVWKFPSATRQVPGLRGAATLAVRSCRTI